MNQIEHTNGNGSATEKPRNIILQGIVGSTAYGLAHEGSDVDRLGIYAAPSTHFWGLTPVKESIVTTQPDITLHEIGKYVRLALKCNPTVIELMWLPEEFVELCNPAGFELRDIRSKFLSARAVRTAYLGYATQQFTRLRNKGSFPDVPRSRIEKHARHLVRLCLQARVLHQRGYVPIELLDPERVWNAGHDIANDPLRADGWIRNTEDILDGPGVLAEQPDVVAVEQWLLDVRASYYFSEMEG